ncbi:MAG: hypothetical protein PUE15_10855 [Prevotella sp.]|nr:hypothetical protein [Prevotella sp.]
MKKPHYYYKVSADSTVGRDIQTFMTKCQEAEEEAIAWAKKQGADHYYESPEGMAGGVGAVEFADNADHEGWEKEVTPDGRVFYFPVESSDLEKEMGTLPVVSEAELFGILDLQPKRTKDNLPLPMTFGDRTPIIFLHNGYWYADVPYVSANVTLAVIEEKEFYRRKMAATNEKK